MGARVTNGLTPEQQKERLEVVRREAERAHDRNDRFFKQVRDRPRHAHGPNCPFDKRRRWHRVSMQLQRKLAPLAQSRVAQKAGREPPALITAQSQKLERAMSEMGQKRKCSKRADDVCFPTHRWGNRPAACG